MERSHNYISLFSQVIAAPQTVFSSRNHKVVTDKEDVQEGNWVNKGKVKDLTFRYFSNFV